MISRHAISDFIAFYKSIFRCLFLQTVAVLIGTHAHQFFENLGKMRGVGITYHFSDIADFQPRIFQKILCRPYPQGIEDIVKAFAGVAVHEL